jgi:acetyl-CoA carboxylase carboxyl transferase subunit alpha
LSLGIIDEVIEEPPGAAHRDPRTTATSVQNWIVSRLQQLRSLDIDTLLEERYQRYRRMGAYLEAAPVEAGAGQDRTPPR